MNTYIWIVDALDCIPSENGENNVVFNVHWRINGISDQSKSIVAFDGSIQTIPYLTTIYGVQPLKYMSENPFIAYDEITKDTVIEWVQEAMGIETVTKLQESIDKQLENLINPQVITTPLPWKNA